jgi:hypothetical protein
MFTNEETEAQGELVTCQMAELRFDHIEDPQ